MRSNKKSNSFILFFTTILFVVFTHYAGSSENESPGHDKNIETANTRKIIVYYFHGKVRCYTCKRIEQLTKDAVSDFFADEIKKGLIALQVIDVDKDENSHFTKDYQLFTRSVVVSDMVNGKEKRWKNLQKVWELVRDEKAFKEYIKSEITAYLL